MKRVFTVIVVTVMATMGFNNTVTAQVEQGNIIIDPYVGFPTMNAINIAEATSLDFKTVGPPISFGLRGEYMAADNFGFGLDVNYAISGYKYTAEDYYFDEETKISSDAEYKYTAKRFRAMVRLNYHFTQSSQLDAYVGVGAGFRNVQRNGYYDGIKSPSLPTLIPISFRLALGGRYYFTDNIGAMLEIGTSGGGLIQFGFSIKI